MSVFLEIRNLYTAFGNSIVHNYLNLSFMKNQLTVLSGGSGSGKTSILNFIINNSDESTGDIMFDGRTIHNRNELLKHISFAPQNGGILSDGTVKDHMMMSIQSSFKVSNEISEELARLYGQYVNLSEKDLNKYPAELSGGMFRRAVLASAIACEPDFLILDEPLAGLDDENARHVSEIIKKLKKLTTILCVTHIPIQADKYLFLFEGSIYEVLPSKLIKYENYPKGIHLMMQKFLHGANDRT